METFEHYQVLKNDDGSYVELGRGAMGVTYKAFDTSLRCHVALKVIRASLLDSSIAEERFLREARSAAQLRHRNVASVFHLGKSGGSYFYAMEFIDGETVDSLVRRDGPLDCLFALEITEQVACALAAAEKRQLVHRDIKPSNLMLVRESDGEVLVKLIDFGLVKSAISQSTPMVELTTSGFVGTPYFASPEQLDQRDEDVRSDIYSLGVTLWFMLTGKPTFVGTLASVIAQHLDKTPAFESLAVLPSQIVALLRRMLEKDAARRIQSPAALRGELKRCIENLRGRTVPAQNAPRDNRCETVALSSSRGLSWQPHAGSMLKRRYRLIEDLDPSHSGGVFHAEDEVLKKRVSLRILRGDAALFAQAEQEVAQVQKAAEPNFVQALALEREWDFGFIVLEWMEGFYLVDLLRARRELSLREALKLLTQLSSAIDRAVELELLPEISLGGVFVHFPDGFEALAIDVLWKCPLDEWPAYVVKVYTLASTRELQPSLTWGGDQSVASGGQSAMVRHLAALAYELLGGDPRRFVPLANVSEEANAVLRRGLSAGHGFGSATEFCEALNQTLASDTGARRSRRPASRPDVTRLLKNPSEPLANTVPPVPAPLAKAVVPPPEQTERKGPPRWRALALAVSGFLVLAGIVAAAAWFGNLFPVQRKAPVAPAPAPLRPARVTTAALNPPQKGKSWTNSLGMRFVPLGDILMGASETRVGDFEAFVKATGYDADGGMVSAVKRDGFAARNLTWKTPGFPQTANYPVVGVCWEDANQFCAWLTKKERNEGALTAFQRYRLPTDREWSEAVGLSHEVGATPEERSAVLDRAYPWGVVFPPPTNAGNYAGGESRQLAQDAFAVLSAYKDTFARTAPVDAFPANRLGLGGLAGNVWEWCMDRFNQSTNWRVLRGGSWATARAREMLSSYRRGYDPLFRFDDAGFRCVIAPDGNPP